MLSNEPHEVEFSEDVAGNVHIDGEVFVEESGSISDTLFYDLYCDSNDEIVAIEFHVDHSSNADKKLVGVLQLSASFDDDRTFPIVWFGMRDGAKPMGLERFGDLRLYQSSNGDYALAFDRHRWST